MDRELQHRRTTYTSPDPPYVARSRSSWRRAVRGANPPPPSGSPHARRRLRPRQPGGAAPPSRPTPRPSRRGPAPSRTGGRRASTRRCLRPVARPSSRGHRRTVASVGRRWARGPRMIVSCMPSDHPAGSVVGATSTPELVTRRSWTCGRSARSISSSTSRPTESPRSTARPPSSASSSLNRRSREGSSAIDRRLPTRAVVVRRRANGSWLGTVSTTVAARDALAIRRVVMGARGTTPDQVAAALSASGRRPGSPSGAS